MASTYESSGSSWHRWKKRNNNKRKSLDAAVSKTSTMSNTLEIRKKKDAKKHYEFYENDKLVATLDYPRRFKKSAIITAGNKQWTIARTGFWKAFYEIEASQSPYSKWKAQQGWRTPLLLRSDDNRQFRFRQTSFWMSKWSWLNEKDEPVIEFRISSWPSKKPNTVAFLQTKDSTMLWFALIGYFLVLCAQEDAAAGTMAV